MIQSEMEIVTEFASKELARQKDRQQFALL
jgi:hypothetical protein